MRTSSFAKWIAAPIAVAAALVAVPFSARAVNGSTTACVLWDVGTDTNGTRLTIHCTNDTNHYTAGYSGCSPAAGPEQIRQWHSQAMAALLAGKNVNLWWNDTCGTRALSGFVMTVQ